MEYERENHTPPDIEARLFQDIDDLIRTDPERYGVPEDWHLGHWEIVGCWEHPESRDRVHLALMSPDAQPPHVGVGLLTVGRHMALSSSDDD